MRVSVFIKSRAGIAALCVALGFSVSVGLAPKNEFFLPNFLSFWISQLVVLACLAMFRPRAEVVGGAAVALAAYLAAFGYWNFSRTYPEAMAWLGYFFSLPGAIVGSVVAARREYGFSNSYLVGLVAFVLVLFGVVINQSLVCLTLMYCGAK